MPTPSSPAAPFQMFCLPHAGGNAVGYHQWKRRFAPWVRVCPVELPGHGTRVREPFATDLDVLLDDITASVVERVDGPYVIFGHSLGGLLAFELARALEALDTVPEGPGRCWSAAATRRRCRTAATARPSAERDPAGGLRALDGVPADLLAAPHVLELFLPPLRADLTLAEQYHRRPGGPLSCPVHVFAGDRDPVVDDAGLRAWSAETTRSCQVSRVPGGHMVLREPELMGEVEAALARVTEGGNLTAPRHP
ncbi:alpha/beta fold hydrolase [Streptomyces sp. M19]